MREVSGETAVKRMTGVADAHDAPDPEDAGRSDSAAGAAGTAEHSAAGADAPAGELQDLDDRLGAADIPDTAAADESAGYQWDDGFIARRATARDDETADSPDFDLRRLLEPYEDFPRSVAFGTELRTRLGALRELVGLSRTRLAEPTLAEAGRVLDEASARQRLSSQHTVVAIAGATGSGKSTLFNALAGVAISETGLRRPTTSAPLACSWTDGAAGLLDRLSIPGRLRRRPWMSAGPGEALHGLVLIDLPDHDSAVTAHRDQVDRVMELVDAVIWVVDPEKYADAALHDRYLKPLAGHAEVTFVVLNQVDRLPGDATDQVLDDLRRLLDDDGMALGEHGEPGATVLALSALTGDGVDELRELLGRFVQERGAAARRLSADVDAAANGLRSAYIADGHPGLGELTREEFGERLGDAVGAAAVGESAEREWSLNAMKACGTPWLRLWRWYESTRAPGGLEPTVPESESESAGAKTEPEATSRHEVEQAVRTVADETTDGLPTPWALAVREAAVRGAEGLPEALDELVEKAVEQATDGRTSRPAWWRAAVLTQVLMTVHQVLGVLWLLAEAAGVLHAGPLTPVLVIMAGTAGGPLVEWLCAMAVRGPARRHGQDVERRLREAAGACGRGKVLDPVAGELLRYREVREQYVTVDGLSTTGK
ncbi:GTPase [Streptomyces sp. NPDC051322]|uniref:YfjP family GTPase n=1 Tax=Streptomyces sp. NPDC051322 TaxID=3154645 RepID=UPI00344CEC35